MTCNKWTAHFSKHKQPARRAAAGWALGTCQEPLESVKHAMTLGQAWPVMWPQQEELNVEFRFPDPKAFCTPTGKFSAVIRFYKSTFPVFENYWQAKLLKNKKRNKQFKRQEMQKSKANLDPALRPLGNAYPETRSRSHKWNPVLFLLDRKISFSLSKSANEEEPGKQSQVPSLLLDGHKGGWMERPPWLGCRTPLGFPLGVVRFCSAVELSCVL